MAPKQNKPTTGKKPAPAKGSQGSGSRKRLHSPSPQSGRAAPNQESTKTLEPASNAANRIFVDPVMIAGQIAGYRKSLGTHKTENMVTMEYKNKIAAHEETLQSILQDSKLKYEGTEVPSDPKEQIELTARSMVVYLSYLLEDITKELEQGNLESARTLASVDNRPFINKKQKFIKDTCPLEHKRSSKLIRSIVELEFTMSKILAIKNRNDLDISAALDVVNESMADRLVQAGADQYTDPKVPYNMQNPIDLYDAIPKEDDESSKKDLEKLLEWTLKKLGLKPAVMPDRTDDKLILEAEWMRKLHSARLAHLETRLDGSEAKAEDPSKKESNIRKHARYVYDKIAIWKASFKRSKLIKGSQEAKKKLEEILSEIDSLQESFRDISDKKDKPVEDLNNKGKA